MNRNTGLVCFVLVVLFVQGCTGHRAVPLPQSREPLFIQGRVRVTMPDSPRMYLDSVTVSADSVVGRQSVLGSGGSRHQRIALSTTNITSVESVRVDAPKTILVVLGSWLVLGGIAIGTQGLLGGS